MNSNYRQGLHIIGTLTSHEFATKTGSGNFRAAIQNFIRELDLQIVGDVYYDFEGGGFTGVVCLTESHLSIHTWPEHGIATLDVFLSNYLHNNDNKTRELFKFCVLFFGAEVENYHEITR